jgi:hypothetical protein
MPGAGATLDSGAVCAGMTVLLSLLSQAANASAETKTANKMDGFM